MSKIKNLLIVMIIAMILVTPFNMVNAKDKKINVYFFHGEGCPHCEEASKFFDKLSKDEEYSKYYNLKKYEVWYSEENNKLMEKVAKELNEQANGVPYIVIGKKTFSGYASDMDSEIKEAIKNAYESKDYEDVIKKVNGEAKNKKDNGAVIPIAITLGIAVIIIGGLVVLAKKM